MALETHHRGTQLGTPAQDVDPRARRLALATVGEGAGQPRLAGDRQPESLARHGVKAAQVLLTHEDLASRRRYLNARRTLERLLAWRVVPVVNENDTVSVDEIKFGDNDALAALVVGLVGAQALVILSDVRGLFSVDPRADPQATLVGGVVRVTADIERLAGGSTSGRGTGGMITKVRAAKSAGQAGAATVVVEGKRAGILGEVLAGHPVGTVFGPSDKHLRGVKRFLAHAARPKGVLRVDDGARTAIAEGGKSLLPAGVRGVKGSFDVGDSVDIADLRGKVFARGVAGYSAEEVKSIMGKKTAEIESVLGYKYTDEVVHRDDMVIL